MSILSAVLSLAKKLPTAVWVGLAGVVASSVVGCYERRQGRQDGALAARQAAHDSAEHQVDSALRALALHLRQDSAAAVASAQAVIPAVDTAQITRSAARAAIVAYLAAHPASRDSSTPVLGSQPAFLDTTGAILAKTCARLAVADSIAVIRAQRALADCQRRGDDEAQQAAAWRRKDSLDTHLVVRPPSRFALEVGAGYDPLQGRPLARGQAELRLFGPLSLAGSLDVEPGVSRPVSPAVLIYWRF